METDPSFPAIKSVSISEYAAETARVGRRVFPGEPGTFWMSNELGSMTRMPTFHVSSSPPPEIREVLSLGGVALASYLLEPSECRPANGLLYTCSDRAYELAKLSSPARRDARRALRRFRFEQVAWGTLLEAGFQAFSDTRTRVGLSDGTVEVFQKQFERMARNPAHHVIGAWKDDVLVAFAALVVVERGVEIRPFLANMDRTFCPINGLIHCILRYFLRERSFEVVSYGLSSIQEGDDKKGLHRFKLKVGFEAHPVRRVFVVRPALHPFVNKGTLSMIRFLLRVQPGNRLLRKASGVLSSLIQE